MVLEARGCKGEPKRAERGSGEMVVLYALLKDFRPKRGKLGAGPKHMGMVSRGLTAPIT